MYFGRGPNKIQKPYTFPDMYAKYIEDKDPESPYHIPYSDFVDICSEFYKGISEYILEGGLYKMPYKLGTISVVKKRPKTISWRSISLDWKSSVETGKQVLHTNDHSNYYKFRFHWCKLKASFHNKSGYRMIVTRETKRKLAQIIKSGDYNYFDV